jgi:hypothetical protein
VIEEKEEYENGEFVVNRTVYKNGVEVDEDDNISVDVEELD